MERKMAEDWPEIPPSGSSEEVDGATPCYFTLMVMMALKAVGVSLTL
jgi:hypothetical protein